MRKLLAALSIAVVAAGGGTAALAASEATKYSVKHLTKVPGSSTGISFKITFGDPDAAGGLPAGLQSFKLKLHKGTKIDPAGAPQCTVTSEDLMAKGAAACPANTRIGTGAAVANAPTGEAVPVDGVIFNEKVGKRNAFLFLFLLNGTYAAAFDAPVKGNTISATGLTGALPGGLVVTQFNGKISKRSTGRGRKKHNLMTAPAKCPKSKSWTNSANFQFVNGDKDTTSSTSPCKA
jgi:hypothetical protein